MGCCSNAITTCPAPASAAQNPSFHVNYTKGMVLGVDDFTQEFAYLAGRDQWIVRELSGAGILRGLLVTAEDDGTSGPRLRIARGSAATPSGKLICVTGDQCGSLNAWLSVKDNADAVMRLLGTGSPPAPPPASSPPLVLPLYAMLCYAESLTAPVPIPGEPCRSDDALMAPSRVADDFKIELRIQAPDTSADDGLRAFVAWLRNVSIGAASPPPAADFAEWRVALQAAAPTWYPKLPAAAAASPPASPPLPIVSQADWPDFVRFAFRFWASEIAPAVGPLCGDGASVDGDCVLLARVEVPVLFAGDAQKGAWQVAGAATAIAIDQTGRGFVIPERLLQEWVFSDPGNLGAAPSSPPALPQALDIGATPAFAGLTLTGAAEIAFTTTAADLNLDATHCCVICTAAATLTLPKAASTLTGRIYIAKGMVANCSVAPAAGDTIDGANARPIPAGGAVTFVCDGTSQWFVIGSTA